MQLHDVHQGVHRRKLRKRVGRGVGSGHGKTSSKGHKGHASRQGFKLSQNFEGGQMPLARRVPKRSFFNGDSRRLTSSSTSVILTPHSTRAPSWTRRAAVQGAGQGLQPRRHQDPG